MDELELRIAALELLAIEVLADLPPETRRAAAGRIAEGLKHALSADETTARRQALQHLSDADARHVLFSRIRPPPH